MGLGKCEQSDLPEIPASFRCMCAAARGVARGVRGLRRTRFPAAYISVVTMGTLRLSHTSPPSFSTENLSCRPGFDDSRRGWPAPALFRGDSHLRLRTAGGSATTRVQRVCRSSSRTDTPALSLRLHPQPLQCTLFPPRTVSEIKALNAHCQRHTVTESCLCSRLQSPPRAGLHHPSLCLSWAQRLRRPHLPSVAGKGASNSATRRSDSEGKN